jgi:alkaline phosphatase D
MYEQIVSAAMLAMILTGYGLAQETGRQAKEARRGKEPEAAPKRQKEKGITNGKYAIPKMIDGSLAGALRIFTNHADPPQTKIDLLTRAYEIFESDEKATYERLVADAAFREIFESNKMTLLGGPMLGQVSQAGAAVWVRTYGPAAVSVRIEDGHEPRLFGPVTSDAKTDFAAVVPISGLQPDTKYPYTIILNGRPVAGAEGVLHTLQPDKARIAFGSCPHRWGLGREMIWDRMLGRDPDALLIHGDIAVQDRKDHFGLHRFDYFMRDLQAPWSKLVANLPVYASWDDHDYLDNDKPRDGMSVPDEDRRAIRRVFTTAWNNPQYGFGDAKGGIFLRTRIGPADVLMTDNRYFRGNEGPLLGEGQMTWLEEQLLDCEGPFIIMSCGTLWNDAKGNGKDSWGKYDKEGRERIFNLIEKHRIPGVLLVSGDWHGARGYTIERPSGFTLYEFQPASLGGRPGATRAGNTLFALAGKYAFGEFTFDAQEDDPSVTFRLILEDGTEHYKLTLTRSQLMPK